jgi:hypothetical protein
MGRVVIAMVMVVTLGLMTAVPAFAQTVTLTPAQGPAGTIVTATGGSYAFNIAPASTRIWFDSNGNNAYDAGELFCQPGTDGTGAINGTNNTLSVPAVTATTYSIRVDIPIGGAVETAANFVVTVPVLTLSPTPATGPAGTVVTVTGTGFELSVAVGLTRVWLDVNGNNAYDLGEPNCQPGTDVNGLIPAVPATANTFNIPAIPAATYQVRADVPIGGAVEAFAPFVVQGATLTAPSPSLLPSGGPGTTVTVAGTNYNPSQAVGATRVWLDVNGNGVYDLGEPNCQPGTDVNGLIPAVPATANTFNIPAVIAPATYNVLADAPLGAPVDGSTTFTVPAVGITLAPATGGPSTTVTITGQGFTASLAGGSTRIWLDLNGNGAYDAATESGVTSQPGTTASGTIAASTINIPAVIAAATYNFLADIPVGLLVEASAPFTVPPAVITLTPATGNPGTLVTITGSGFGSVAIGVIWFDSDGDSVLDAGETSIPVTTSATGAIPAGTSLPIPAVAAGTYNIRADVPSGGAVEASASFVVVVPVAAITLTPTTGNPGTVINITGSNFAVNTAGNIWFDSDGDSILDPGENFIAVTTTATGTIPGATTLSAPSVAALNYSVRADIPVGTPVEASAIFQVTAAPPAVPQIFSVSGTANLAAGASVNIVAPAATPFFGTLSIQSTRANYDVDVVYTGTAWITVVETGALNASYSVSGFGLRISNDTTAAMTVTYVFVGLR